MFMSHNHSRISPTIQSDDMVCDFYHGSQNRINEINEWKASEAVPSSHIVCSVILML